MADAPMEVEPPPESEPLPGSPQPPPQPDPSSPSPPSASLPSTPQAQLPPPQPQPTPADSGSSSTQADAATQPQSQPFAHMRPPSFGPPIPSPSPSSSSAPSPFVQLPPPSSMRPRAGFGATVVMPTHHLRPPHTAMGFSTTSDGLSPSPGPHFGPLHRPLDHSSPSGVQLHPTAVSGSQHPRLGQSTTRPTPTSLHQPLNSQKVAVHGVIRTPQMASPSPLQVSSHGQQPALQSTASSVGKQMQSPSPSPLYSVQQKSQPQAFPPRPHQLAQSIPATSSQQSLISTQQQKLQQKQLQQQQQLQQQKQLQQQQQHALHQNLSHEQLNQHTVSLRSEQVPGIAQSSDVMVVDTTESSNRILSKRSIRELVAQIDPSEKLELDVEDTLIDIAEDFVESLTTFACSLAKHRKSTTLEAKDILLHAERNWNITLPGYIGDEIKCYKKQHVNDIHKERLHAVRKSMAGSGDGSHAKSFSASQFAANQKS